MLALADPIRIDEVFTCLCASTVTHMPPLPSHALGQTPHNTYVQSQSESELQYIHQTSFNCRNPIHSLPLPPRVRSNFLP